MRILYQKKISPFCFKVRLVLDEKGLEYHTINKGKASDLDDIRQMDPSGNLPILLDEGDIIISHHHAICEYLDSVYEIGLLGRNPIEKSEVLKMSFWFDEKFYNEVSKHLLNERYYKILQNGSVPSGRIISIARANLEAHLRYFSFILSRYNFISGDFMSLADFAGASQLAVLDYLNEINWDKFKEVKDWYVKIKSRKSFKSILKERVKNMLPPPHYSNLDF